MIPIKINRFFPMVVALGIGASLALTPNNAKAITVVSDLQGSPIDNNSIKSLKNKIWTVGGGAAVISTIPNSVLTYLQAAFDDVQGTLTTASDIFSSASTSVSFALNPYSLPTSETLTFGPTTSNNVTSAMTAVSGWAFTLAGDSVPVGHNRVL
jgi:hypothetical protein